MLELLGILFKECEKTFQINLLPFVQYNKFMGSFTNKLNTVNSLKTIKSDIKTIKTINWQSLLILRSVSIGVNLRRFHHIIICVSVCLHYKVIKKNLIIQFGQMQQKTQKAI